MRVVVVGAGWAGLAAAVSLAARGHHPIVLEASKEPGGRGRATPWGELAIDNGQHLLIGAYESLLGLLQLIGVEESSVLLRRRMRIDHRSARNEGLCLALPPIMAPFHLLAALGRAKGLRLRDRRAALAMGYRLWRNGFQLAEECTVAELLSAHHQTRRLTEHLWGPVCLAALNTPPESASGRIFLRVLRDTFLYRRRDSDLLFPRVSLGELFPEPAARYVIRRGGEMHYRQRVTHLLQQGERVVGAATRSGEFPADQVILATPPRASARVLQGLPHAAGLAERIGGLGTTPITTLYLQYPTHVKLRYPMVSLDGGPAHWLFDRGNAGAPGLMAAVISGPGDHERENAQRLTERVVEQLHGIFPRWPAPENTRVINEKEATFDCVAHVDQHRPGFRTEIPGLLLAGDYTNTGYPATLEGALRSGVRCARSLAGTPLDRDPLT